MRENIQGKKISLSRLLNMIVVCVPPCHHLLDIEYSLPLYSVFPSSVGYFPPRGIPSYGTGYWIFVF